MKCVLRIFILLLLAQLLAACGKDGAGAVLRRSPPGSGRGGRPPFSRADCPASSAKPFLPNGATQCMNQSEAEAFCRSQNRSPFNLQTGECGAVRPSASPTPTSTPNPAQPNADAGDFASRMAFVDAQVTSNEEKENYVQAIAVTIAGTPRQPESSEFNITSFAVNSVIAAGTDQGLALTLPATSIAVNFSNETWVDVGAPTQLRSEADEAVGPAIQVSTICLARSCHRLAIRLKSTDMDIVLLGDAQSSLQQGSATLLVRRRDPEALPFPEAVGASNEEVVTESVEGGQSSAADSTEGQN